MLVHKGAPCGASKTNTGNGIKILHSKDIIQASKEASALVKRINIFNIRDKCSDFCKAINQQNGLYGFLPINNLLAVPEEVRTGPKKLTWEDFNPVELHYKIFNSGKYSFLGEHIQLPTRIGTSSFYSDTAFP